MSKLRALAQGRECLVRIFGVCNGNPETTVLCHFRMAGISGFGYKSPDLIAAWLCSACHAHVDIHKDCQTQLDFAKAVFRTQARLIEEGEVKW
jgi:hypothetical protein